MILFFFIFLVLTFPSHTYGLNQVFVANENHINNAKLNDLSEYIEKHSTPNAYRVILHPRHKIKIHAEVKAKVSKIPHRFGDSFNKGDILILLDDKKLQGKFEKAKSFLEKAESELETIQDLYKDDMASKFELKEAEAKLSEAKAEFIIAKQDLKATRISAPYAGKVSALYIDEYEFPTENRELLEIVDDKVLIAKLLVKSDLLDKLKVGVPISVTIDETQQEIEAEISRIGATIDPSSSTFKVEAEINNEDGKLKPGMVGTVKFHLSD